MAYFSLLIGANVYYFKPYNGWSLTKTVSERLPSFRPNAGSFIIKSMIHVIMI